MKISRRELLKLIPALAVAASFPTTFIRAAENPAKAPGKRLLVGSENQFCMLDLQSGKSLLDVTLPYFPHSFLQQPGEPDKIWSFQRYNYDLTSKTRHLRLTGPYISRATQVDIASGKITRVIEAPKGRVMNGHGLFLPDSDILYSANAVTKTGEGYLTGYDTHTGKIVADHLVSEAGIHECRTASDGSVFLARSGVKTVTNADGKKVDERIVKSGLVHYDLQNDKRISFTPIEEAEQYLGHFCLLQNGDIIATAVQIDYTKNISPLAYMGREGDKALMPLQYNNDVVGGGTPGELFNVGVLEESNMGVISSIANNYVILADLEKKTLVKKIDFIAPWGIVVDKDKGEFIISGDEYIGVIDSDFTTMKKIPLSPRGPVNHFSSGHSLFI